jgi:hypothetical protein
MKIQTKFLLLFVTALVGCATAYQPQGLTGGFSEIQLEKNVFRISIRGNGYTSLDRAGEMALLRSAELSLKNGFTHFAIVDEKADYHTFMNPLKPQTTIDSTTNAKVNAGSSSASAQVASTTTIGESIGKRPLNTSTIVCFNGKPDVKFYVYDAQLIFNSMSQRYGIK